MKKILTVYTIDNCHSCDHVKNYLRSHDLEFNEVRVNEEDEALREELVQRSGRRGFPQVFAGALALDTKQKIESYVKLVKGE